MLYARREVRVLENRNLHWLAQIPAQLPVGLVVLDQGGNVIYLNDSARHLLPGVEPGANLSAVPGIPVDDLAHQMDVVFSGKAASLPVILASVPDACGEGTHRHISLQLAPLGVPGERRMVVASVVDVTQQEEVLRREFLRQTVRAMAPVIEMRDPYTGSHSASVAYFAVELAKEVGLPPDRVQLIRFAGEAHDFGKVGIPDAILLKPGKLTPEEYEVVKQHPVTGSNVFRSLPQMEEVRRIIRHHHERWDGQGYPDGLAGDAIPLESQIISVADAFHAMVSDRPYRKGMPVERACSILQEERGKQFNPYLVDLFLSRVVPRLKLDGGNPLPALED